MEYIIKHNASVKDLCSVDFHTITTNDPYIDAHLDSLTKNPVSQTIKNFKNYKNNETKKI